MRKRYSWCRGPGLVSVLPGHPDKIADQISDLVLDEYLRHDPNSRTAIEVLVTHKKIIISGETKGPIIQNHKIESVVREFLKNLNYRQYIKTYRNGARPITAEDLMPAAAINAVYAVIKIHDKAIAITDIKKAVCWSWQQTRRKTYKDRTKHSF